MSILPRKLYVEVTTRCNLRCEKCIKQVHGNGICDGDFSLASFKKIVGELSEVKQLVLNGIGEPLLHPDLVTMVALAAEKMSPKSSIGFQTNGVLLSERKAFELINAGVTTVCFSLDSLANGSDKNEMIPLIGTSLYAVERAVSLLHKASKTLGRDLQIGLEIVVSSENVVELPDMVRWAIKKNVDYVLVTHLFAYDQEMAAQSLFSTNSRAAIALFEEYRESAKAKGVDLKQGVKAYLKYEKSETEKVAIKMLQQMSRVAAEQNIPLHFDSLFLYDAHLMMATQNIFALAQDVAEKENLSLSLPSLYAEFDASCAFIEEQAAFITFRGDVTPCHFLWHSYPCMSGTDSIDVEQKSFGSVNEKSLQQIWQSDAYINFREEASLNDFSPCWSCSQGPCSDLLDNNLLGANDCYGSKVPCGHCRWNIGGLACL